MVKIPRGTSSQGVYAVGHDNRVNGMAAHLLASLLLADLTFLVLDGIAAATPWLDSSMFSIKQDRGYPEIYQYVKLFSIAILYAHLALESRLYVAWALVFAYFLADDALMIHETVGRYLGYFVRVEPPLSFRRQDIGEIVVSAIAGLGLFSVGYWFYKRGTPSSRRASRQILLLVLLFAAFGVGVDSAHHAIGGGRVVSFFLVLVEDGGEMVTASLILYYTVLLHLRPHSVPNTLILRRLPAVPAGEYLRKLYLIVSPPRLAGRGAHRNAPRKDPKAP